MIISCEHEIVGKESILRIWPAQDPREGKDLADNIESLAETSSRIYDAEQEKEEAESRASRLEEKYDSLKDAVLDAISKMREINKASTKVQMIADAEEALELLQAEL